MDKLRWWLRWGMIMGIIGGLFAENSVALEEREKNIISYTQFLDEVETKKVKEVRIICQETIEGEYVDGNKFTTHIPYYDENLIKMLRENEVVLWYGEKPREKEEPFWLEILKIWLFPIALMLFIFWICFNSRWGLMKSQSVYWNKMPKQMEEIIKRLDSLIELLKEKK